MQSILEKGDSVLQTAMDFLDAASGRKKNEESKKDDTYLGGSISKYTKDLVMTFPTMFDTSLSPSTAGMVSKAHERNIVTMLTLLFASMQVEAQSGRAAIQKVHNNINTSSASLLDIYDAVTTHESGNNIAGIRCSDVLTEMTDYLKTKSFKSYPANSFKNTSLNDYVISKDYLGRTVVREKASTKPSNPGSTKLSDPGFDYEGYRKNQREERKDAREEEISRSREAREQRKERRDEQIASLPRVMTDQDYKKANELAPSLMVITFNEVDSAGNKLGKTAFAAGVKSRLIPVESSDIIERLAAKKNTALNFTNFIRATTGEISFVKDFLFCIQQSKILAKNSAKKGAVAKMWNVLDSRHVKNTKNNFNKQGNDAAAIAALVVNQETVNMLKKEYNFNIEEVKTAKYIMDEYNFLALIICDESVEVAKSFYHGNDGFEQMPYSFLARENDNAKAYKDVINLVNQTRR